MEAVFNYWDYKKFLNETVEGQIAKRGYLTKMAQAAGCQLAYLSKVLHAHIHLTPEHACHLAHFLALSELETEYFLCLVDFNRAGTTRLQQRLRLKLENLKKDAKTLSKRVRSPELSDPEAQARYYSAWYWAGIHILVSSSEFQTPEEISRRLNLPMETVLGTLRGLKTLGLVKNDNDRWHFVGADLNISQYSPLSIVNHQNWRARAMIDAQNLDNAGLHYSAVFTISRLDRDVLKQQILALLEKQRKTVAASGSEELYCFTCDFFKP